MPPRPPPAPPPHDSGESGNANDSDNSDDLAAFRAAVAGATPLRDRKGFIHARPKPRPHPRQRELDEVAAIAESLHGPLAVDDLLDFDDTDSFACAGLPRTVLRDLRRGRWVIQKHVDLHGMNRHEAHAAIGLFLAEALAEGKRCLRIVHGRGHGSPGRTGILRQLVKAWLTRSKDVLAFCHAPPRDGGDGALWVLLRGPSRR